MRDYSRFDRYLDKLAKDVYPEPEWPHCVTITHEAIEQLIDSGTLKPGMRVLDVGCGQGLALTEFRARGIEAVGVTLGEEDCAACRAKGFDVHEMDQNFIDFPDASFDFLWCRHVLEHSVAPLFTLSEYHRLLKPGCDAYVEVPAPGTVARHENNPNHYSVFPAEIWANLFGRTGFTVVSGRSIGLTLPHGQDAYYCFFLRRDDAAPSGQNRTDGARR